REVEQEGIAAPHPFENRELLLPRLSRMQRPRRDPLRRERLDLILHERDERRHHYYDSRVRHGRKLEAERLPPAGRHDGESVFFVENGPNDFLLPAAKSLQSE